MKIVTSFSNKLCLSIVINKHESSSVNEYLIHSNITMSEHFQLVLASFFFCFVIVILLYRHALHINLEAIIFFLSVSCHHGFGYDVGRILNRERKDKIET